MPLSAVLLYQPQVFASALGLNIAVGSNGQLSLYTSSTAHLVLDAVGYYMPAGSPVVERAVSDESSTGTSHSHLPPAAVIGIVIACLIVAAALVAVAVVLVLRRQKAKATDYQAYVVNGDV